MPVLLFYSWITRTVKQSQLAHARWPRHAARHAGWRGEALRCRWGILRPASSERGETGLHLSLFLDKWHPPNKFAAIGRRNDKLLLRSIVDKC